MLLDDGVNLQPLVLMDSHPEYWWDIVRENGSGVFGRSISMASFVLERYLIGSNLFMLKLTNLVLHLLIGCIVFLLAGRLLARSGIRRANGYALFVAALWLLTPFFVSTVLYVVQRMAQLSAFFMFSGLLLYVIGRARLEFDSRGWVLIATVPLLGLLAVLSKENGVLLVPLLMLTEICFFSFSCHSLKSARLLKGLHIAALLLPLLFVIAYGLFGSGGNLLSFDNRPFSLIERLLTQFTILWEYLYHLIWPTVSGLGVNHDDYLFATGLMTPPITIISVLSWLIIIFAMIGMLYTRRFLSVCFGTGFFLIGHLIESTVIPLELYFEHRNYLPAFGVYFLIALVLAKLAQRYREMSMAIATGAALYVCSFGFQMGIQASIWSNQYVLAAAGYRDHPNSIRANMLMAKLSAEAEDVASALQFSHAVRDIKKETDARDILRDVALYCMGDESPPDTLYVALARFKRSIRDVEANENLQIITTNILEGTCPNFDAVKFSNVMADFFTGRDRLQGTSKIYALLAKLENELGGHAQANEYVGFWLKKEPEEVQALLMRVYFSSLLEESSQKSEALKVLTRLDGEGKLNRQERDTYLMFN